jgi:hypothetical protein
MNTVNLKFTKQEQEIINYLSDKEICAWEELAQFGKDPSSVKLKTIKRVVSEVKRKYVEAQLPIPFNCKLVGLTEALNITGLGEKQKETGQMTNVAPKEQVLVKMKSTPSGNLMPADSTELVAHVDFKLDKSYRRVKTRAGSFELGENEWLLFTYLHDNAEKFVTLEDMKNVVYKNWGSKTPHNWADSISRSLTKIRKNIPELKLKGRLLTITTSLGTSYMLK